jgi:hypothetical protein
MMADAILFDHYTLPERGAVDLQIHWLFDIQVTATEARQKVDSWLLDEVSTMIGAGEPLLVIDGTRTVWRVTAIFTAPHIGEVGVAGMVDIDVQSGEIMNADECKETLLQGAQALARKMPPYQPRTGVPKAYLAKDQQPTITRPQGDPLEIIAITR